MNHYETDDFWKLSNDELKELELTEEQLGILRGRVIAERNFSINYKNPKVWTRWVRAENSYNMWKENRIDDRSSIPLSTLFGYLNTLQSKIDDAPVVEYGYEDLADKRAADYNTAIYKKLSSDPRCPWQLGDLQAKKYAALYGRAITRLNPSVADGTYRVINRAVKPHNFHIDPAVVSSDMETAAYMGEDNHVFNAYDLLASAKEMGYDEQACQTLVDGYQNGTFLRTDVISGSQNLNFSNSLGLQKTMTYESDPIVAMTHWFTTFRGVRFYVFFDPVSNIVVQAAPLVSIFDANLYPYRSWAFDPQDNEFWSLSAADVLMPSAEIREEMTNEIIDNVRFRNGGSLLYDMDRVPNPTTLDLIVRGLTPVKGDPNTVVAQRTIPSIDSALALIDKLETMDDKNSGISSNAMGVSDSGSGDTLGEVKINMSQVADRMSLQNKHYANYYTQIGLLLYYMNLQYMTDEIAVELLGEEGVEYRTIKPNQIAYRKNPRVKISGSTAIKAESDAKLKAKASFWDYMLLNKVGDPKKVIEKKAIDLGIKADEIRAILDDRFNGTPEIIAEAAEENLKLLKKDVPPNSAATVGHVKWHMQFIDNNDLTAKQKARVLAHIESEMPIAEAHEQDSFEAEEAKDGLSRVPNAAAPIPAEEIPPLDSAPADLGVPADAEVPAMTQ